MTPLYDVFKGFVIGAFLEIFREVIKRMGLAGILIEPGYPPQHDAHAIWVGPNAFSDPILFLSQDDFTDRKVVVDLGATSQNN